MFCSNSCLFSLFQTSPLLTGSLLFHLHSFQTLDICHWLNKYLSPSPTGGGLLHPAATGLRPEEEEGERGDMAFLKDLLSPGPGAADEFSREWQDAFGLFDAPSIPPAGTGAASSSGPDPAARPPSHPPSPTGFLPSQLLDHSLSSTGEPHCPLLEG